MEKQIEVDNYNKYLNEYVAENKLWNNDDIREDLKVFSMKLKSAIKVSLEDIKETYDDEKPYMLTLSYFYGYEDTSMWTIVSTETEYEKSLSDLDEDENTHADLMYYRYCPEESCHFDAGKYAFDILNDEFKTMVLSQEYDDSDEDSFWNADEFDDFYEEFEETCLKSIEDIKSEGFLDKLDYKNMLFQFYVREYYSEEDELNMFERLNKNNKTAVKEFEEWL